MTMTIVVTMAPMSTIIRDLARDPASSRLLIGHPFTL